MRVIDNPGKQKESKCRGRKVPEELSEAGESLRGTESHCPILLDESSTEEEPPNRVPLRSPQEEA